MCDRLACNCSDSNAALATGMLVLRDELHTATPTRRRRRLLAYHLHTMLRRNRYAGVVAQHYISGHVPSL